MTPGFKFLLLTPGRWKDLEKLFGPRGACGGCWCMTWRLEKKHWQESKGIQNKRSFKKIVQNGERPGVIAYQGKEPVGWCALAPRDRFVFLKRSRVLAPLDDAKVWSITCLFIARPYRQKGLSVQLLKAAAALAKKQGAKIVEAYPVLPYSPTMPAAFAWTGFLSAYLRAGFEEVARRSKPRPIVRKCFEPRKKLS